MREYLSHDDVFPEGRLKRMARAYNCRQIASDPRGLVIKEFLNTWRVGTPSQTNGHRLGALQEQLVEQE
jgi:hypothetical protein